MRKSWLVGLVACWAIAACGGEDEGAAAPVPCGDGVCAEDESCASCAADCGVCPVGCGDGTCAAGENCASCQADCGVCPASCGDGTCTAGESCASCQADCGVCPASCGDGVCSGGEACGTCPGDCGSCVSAQVSWDFPVLVPGAGGVAVFPSYVAHLLGRPRENHPWELETACATIRNEGSAPLSVTLEATLAGFSEPGRRSSTVPAGGQVRECVNPVPDLAALYALQAPTPSNLQVSVTATDGTLLGSASHTVKLLPGNDILWGHPSVALPAMRDLSAVFVTPHDPQVEELLTAVSRRSVFGGFGSSPYVRSTYDRSLSLAVSYYASERVILEPGERIDWRLRSVTGGSDSDVDVYLFTLQQFEDWQNGTGTAATRAWRDQLTGATGSFSANEYGAYQLVLFNTSDNYLSRSVSWTRSNTREDVVRDALGAIFAELRQRGITYVSVPLSYFSAAQHIKRTDEVLATRSANCIDGSLLFASVLELIGMEPLLVFRSGHAYVALHSAPGSEVFYPLETTMVGTSASFDDAYLRGLQELVNDAQNDANFHLTDVKAQRQAGLTPVPL